MDISDVFNKELTLPSSHSRSVVPIFVIKAYGHIVSQLHPALWHPSPQNSPPCQRPGNVWGVALLWGFWPTVLERVVKEPTSCGGVVGVSIRLRGVWQGFPRAIHSKICTARAHRTTAGAVFEGAYQVHQVSCGGPYHRSSARVDGLQAKTVPFN